MNFDPAGVRAIYDSAISHGYKQGLHVGWHRGYAAGQQAQALTDEQLIEALAWAQHDLRILEENRVASIRSTITDLQALNYRKKRSPRRSAA